MIIGITGFNGSGKTTTVAYLQQKSFQPYSLSDLLREKLQETGKDPTRENLIHLGNTLRKKHGQGILGEMILKKLQESVHYVIDSIRNPGEVEALQTREDFVLIHVDAPTEIRFERMIDRKRENIETNYEDILKFEQQELESEDAHKQQLLAVSRMAKIVLVNDDDLDTLYKKIDKMVLDLHKRYNQRPNWDAYYIAIANTVAKRSNCMKRKVASVIIKDKHIISTGYNGTPRGTMNCNEGGCPRCNTLTDGGTALIECLCSHGEENAIVQAAYHGISLKGSTLYTTFSPCLICAKMIINAGVNEVVYNLKYPLNDVTFALLQEGGVDLRQYES